MLIINEWYLKVKNVSTIRNIRVTFQKNLSDFLPDWLSKNRYMELLKISFRQPEVVLALAKMVHDVHEKQNVPNPL